MSKPGNHKKGHKLKMNRSQFIQYKRQQSRERFDSIYAPIYDQDWGSYINPSHQRFVEHVIRLIPPGSLVVDAACGTGKYWPMLLAAGMQVEGIDQSAGMLQQAHAKFPDVSMKATGLQELDAQAYYDAVLCIDAMEDVSPEEWSGVLANLQQAVKPGGYLYLTVELPDRTEVEESYCKAQEQGLPVLFGEMAHEDGYHYYPSLEQVRKWLDETGLTLLEEAEGDGYEHYLMSR